MIKQIVEEAEKKLRTNANRILDDVAKRANTRFSTILKELDEYEGKLKDLVQEKESELTNLGNTATQALDEKVFGIKEMMKESVDKTRQTMHQIKDEIEEQRDKIKQSAEKLIKETVDEAQESIDRVKVQLAKEINDKKFEVEELARNVKDGIDKAKKDAKDSVSGYLDGNFESLMEKVLNDKRVDQLLKLFVNAIIHRFFGKPKPKQNDTGDTNQQNS